MAMYDLTESLAHLERTIQGEVTNAPEATLKASFDFGRIITRTPGLVVSPVDSQDISRLFHHANRHRIPITTQGASHTQGGHSLNSNGIVLQTHRLKSILQINTEEASALVECGIRWNDFMEATLALGYLPPVVTTNLHTTVGGTHSVGGVGVASVRYGSQADICLGFEMVLPTGEIIWCSSQDNEELFGHVPGGLGQFGVITKLKVPIRKYKPKTRILTVVCGSLEQFIDAIRRLMSSGCPGIADFGGIIVEARPTYGLPSRNRYLLRFTVETDTCDESRDGFYSMLLGNNVVMNVAEMDTEMFARGSLGSSVDKSRWDRAAVDPGFHCILPARNAERSIADILCIFAQGSTGLDAVEYYLLPAYRRRFRKPLLKMPEDDVVFVFGCSPRFDKRQEQVYHAIMMEFAECVQKWKGKHYPIGCSTFCNADWVDHYGESWSAMDRLKQKVDPNHILSDDLYSRKGGLTDARNDAAPTQCGPVQSA